MNTMQKSNAIAKNSKSGTKATNQHLVKLVWQEVKADRTIQDKSYACNQPDAMWHVMQMRKSPGLIVNIKIER